MSRRQARELALQVLFQVDIGKARPEAAMEYAAREKKSLNQEDLAFARKIILGTLEYLEPIDRVISRVSHDWELNRMAAVDRNIIRLALFEIFYCADIPLAVSVDEAVELAKAYGGDDSSRFINGILGKVVKDPASYLKS
ncbi:MAG: transcription antitermination factor NusB [Bacillota bacterium]